MEYMQEFTKIDSDFYDVLIEKGEDIEDYLVDNIRCFFIDSLSYKDICFQQSLIDCESPIEQKLSLAFEHLNIKDLYIYNPFVDVVEIEKQAEIQCENKKYRVDFLIPVVYKNQENKCFVIECDGYEFHQKTKEQVERDNVRTRDLQKVGYEIIRFSGTEIWSRPYKCARDVLNIILSKCKYLKEEEYGKEKNGIS